MKKLIFLISISLFLLSFVSCSKENKISVKETTKQTITSSVSENSDKKSINNEEETKSTTRQSGETNQHQQLEKKQNESAIDVNESLTPLQKLFAQVRFQIPNKELKSINFKLKDLEGKTVSLDSFKGKVVFLNFWATWCPPCRAEIPSMIELYNRFKSKGLEIVGVDLQEDKATVAKFVKQYKMNYTVLLDTTGQVGQIYGARSIPTTYIVDRRGNILARTIGTREWNSTEIIKLFEEILKQ